MLYRMKRVCGLVFYQRSNVRVTRQPSSQDQLDVPRQCDLPPSEDQKEEIERYSIERWEGQTDLFSLGQDEVDHPFRMISKEIALEQQVVRMGGFSGGLHVFVCSARLG
jgi:hypothetical protein